MQIHWLTLTLALLISTPAFAQDFDCSRTEMSNGFRLECITDSEGDSTPVPVSGADIEARDVQRYVAYGGDIWAKFHVHGLRNVSAFTMRVVLSNSVDSITCTEDIPALPQGTTSPEALIIPPYFCTPSREIVWDSIRFEPPTGITCSNCGNPPVRRAFPPVASDRREMDAIINDLIFRERER